MIRIKSLQRLAIAVFVLGMMIYIPLEVAGQTPLVSVKIDDVVCEQGTEDVSIPVYLKNYGDTIGGMLIWAQLDRPDVFEFDGILESGKLLPVYWITFDTSNTLLSGWAHVDVVSMGLNGYDAKIIALCEGNPGIGYYDGDMPLIKLIANVYPASDTSQSQTANIMLTNTLQYTQFSDNHGYLIGFVEDTVVDTICYNCTYWVGDTCMNWVPVEEPYGDTCIYDTSIVMVYDSTLVELNDGSLTAVSSNPCGDFNGDGNVDLLDVIVFILYLYEGDPGPIVWPVHYYDINGDESVDLLDIVYLINFLYNGGPPPVCD